VLTNLDLSYNNLAGRGCAALAEALGGLNAGTRERGEPNTRIRELSLRGNNMGDVGARALNENISERNAIAKIDLSDNGIGEAGGENLGLLLSNAKKLKQADFSWNAVGIRGTEKIAEALRSSECTVVRLNLAWNGMTDAGAEYMSGALAANTTMQFLDLSSNRIGFPGATAIAKGIEENQTLRSLQLNGNPIGDKGVATIIEAVASKYSVRDLGLQDCAGGDAPRAGSRCVRWKGGQGIFDKTNPTGQYALQLSDEFDLETFKKLLDQDKMDEASGIDNFINLKLDGVELAFKEGEDIQSWGAKPPPAGLLEFDYVSTKRVPKEAKPQREEVFLSFRKELSNPALSDETKLLMLRSAATTHYWSSAQVRQLVMLITYRRRVDAVVMLFRRTTDLPQFYSEVWTLLKRDEQQALRRRLGESLARLLKEHEPVPADDGDTAFVFMTEVDGGGYETGAGATLQASMA